MLSSLKNTVSRFYFISPKQAIKEIKQEIRELLRYLLLPDFLSMVSRTVKNSGNSLLGFFIIMGLLNAVCLVFSIIFISMISLMRTIGATISNFGKDIERLSVTYLLAIDNAYSVSFVVISIFCFVFWWTNKRRSKGDRRR